MFRLVKLAAFVLLGYAIYEFMTGVMEEGGPRQFAGSGTNQPGRRRRRSVSTGGRW